MVALATIAPPIAIFLPVVIVVSRCEAGTTGHGWKRFALLGSRTIAASERCAKVNPPAEPPFWVGDISGVVLRIDRRRGHFPRDFG